MKDNALEDFVTYHGIVGGDAKRKLLKKCDIFVLLTRYPNEGQPISILEAMGNGMVIVTTDHAGIPDIVENEVNGILVNLKSGIQIETIMKRLMDVDFKSCERKNRASIVNKFQEQQYIKNISAIYDEM